MKKITVLTSLFVALATTVFAQNPVAPSCVQAEYPMLYTGASHYIKSPNSDGDDVKQIVMTIPIEKVEKVGRGTYRVIHPVYKNECAKTTTIVKDDDGMNSFNKAFRKLKRDGRATVGVLFEYINGQLTSVRIHSFG